MCLCLFKGDFTFLALFLETQVFVVCHFAMVAEFKLELRGSEVGVLGLLGHIMIDTIFIVNVYDMPNMLLSLFSNRS